MELDKERRVSTIMMVNPLPQRKKKRLFPLGDGWSQYSF